MDATLTRLLTSDLIKLVSNDAIVVYLVLRSDVAVSGTFIVKMQRDQGKLTSGLDLQTISDRLDIPLLTTQRCIDDLVRECWVVRHASSSGGSVYQLGFIENFETGDLVSYHTMWFIDKLIAGMNKPEEPKRTSAVDDVHRLMGESQKRREAAKKARRGVPEKVKKKLVTETGFGSEVKDSTRLLRSFGDHYELHFKKKLNLSKDEGCDITDAYRRTHVHLRRLIKWSGDEWSDASSYVVWVMDNWNRIKKAMMLVGTPTVALLSTKKVYLKLMRWKQEGIPEPYVAPRDVDGVAGRGDALKHELEEEGL